MRMEFPNSAESELATTRESAATQICRGVPRTSEVLPVDQGGQSGQN